ncbi:MAG: pyridoxal-phosphate dependent enzyme [Desulfurococcales archaeon]|nr:pyridoxal-phosphate dependent enzyme [Desulfurococcales archaeon]MCE4627127.1 pyridoxal-phosphate dependent enzyme [Desulfurococcales archaeon]
MSWSLYCPKCGWEGGSEDYYPFCPKCGSPLELKGTIPVPPKPILGEGNTPLVEDERGVAYKLEYLNPTGSFKDRGTSYSLYLAKQLGYKCVVVDSSGNTALSVAGYAGILGLKARVHVPASASKGKIALLKFMGAEVVIHPTRELAAEAARREIQECFYVAHATSPIFLKGIESLGRELAGEASDRTIFVPASSGTLLIGVYRGLVSQGVEPRIVAVQSPAAASLANRVKVLERLGSKSRLLDALVVKNPPRIEEMVEAATLGVVIVGDEYASVAWRRLAERGFIVEPSSATVLVASDALGEARPLLILTGSGLKYHDRMAEEIEAK